MGRWFSQRKAWLGLVGVIGFLAAPLPAAAAGASAQIISCTGFAGCFSPNPIRIAAGTSITWTNRTTPTHTATSDTGAWDTGSIAAGQTSPPITFNQAGTFTYHCAIHPSMTGSIIVSAAVTASAAPTSAPSSLPRALAPGGGGPAPLFGWLALMLGLALLAWGRLRRERLQRAAEAGDKPTHQ